MSGNGNRRILITAIAYYPDAPSGSAKLAYDEANFLASQGHEVWLAAPKLKPDHPDYEICDGVNILRYRRDQYSAVDPRKIWQSRVGLRNCVERHCSSKFDVIHGHVPLQHDAALHLDRAGAEICYSVHSPLIDELELGWPQNLAGTVRRFAGLPLARRIERRCLLKSDRITCFSRFTKDALSRHHGGVSERIRIIPGWTDLNRFRIAGDRNSLKNRLGWRVDVPVLFTLRRLVARMGLDRLIHSAKILRDQRRRFQLVIGGRGVMRPELERLVSELSLQEYVRFLGYVPDEDLPSVFAACDAFVLPTASLECFGIIAADAMACGRPVLATPVAAIPEMVGEIEPRWLADSAESGAIARLLSDYLSGNLPLHEPESIREFVARNYDRERVITRYCNYILNEEHDETR